jgi:hypothetical protein
METRTPARALRVGLVATFVCGFALSSVYATPDSEWPPNGARSPAELCAWFRAHEDGSAVPATCRVVCRASRGPVKALVLRRGTGFHEGLAVAIRDGGRFRVVHDDVDDAHGVVIQGGAWGSLDVRRCAFTPSGTSLEIDVARVQAAEPPNACDVTRDVQRITCAGTGTAYACTRSVLEAPVTTRDAARSCTLD